MLTTVIKPFSSRENNITLQSIVMAIRYKSYVLYINITIKIIEKKIAFYHIDNLQQTITGK